MVDQGFSANEMFCPAQPVPACIDSEFIYRARSEYLALKKLSVSCEMKNKKEIMHCADKVKGNVKHSIVIERRFRNRIARKFKVGHRSNDEQDVRFREQCERSQDCVQYTKQEEIELRQFEVWRGRGQRLYNGHGVSSELFHSRRKTTGEIAHACLSRMSGSGSFPSPIAHAARVGSQLV